MKIRFQLSWSREGTPLKRAFKSTESQALFEKFLKWTGRYTAIEASVGPFEKNPASHLWICHPSRRAKTLSSEDLAESLLTLQSSGIKEWVIGIGGPDGFSDPEIEKLNPHKLWSFGPLTLPHELAAVIASEQIYRAFTILHHHPYHGGH